MVAEMLPVESARAAGLARAVEPCTPGNPYETVELLNALRREGCLPGAHRWRWDAATVRPHVGRAEVVGLVIAGGPAADAGRQLVEMMACLGGGVEVGVLRAASGLSATVVEQVLAPRWRTVCWSRGRDGGRRCGSATTGSARRPGGLDPPGGQALQLAMARRLAGVPDWSRSRPSSTCRWLDGVREPPSGARSRGCCGVPPARPR